MNPISRPSKPRLGVQPGRPMQRSLSSAASTTDVYFSDTGGHSRGGGRYRVQKDAYRQPRPEFVEEVVDRFLTMRGGDQEEAHGDLCSTCSSSSDSEFDYYLERPRVTYVGESSPLAMTSPPTGMTSSSRNRKHLKKTKSKHCVVS
jgi:hypothetical protein